MKTKLINAEILDKAHHRNGVGGMPFTVAIIDDKENGKMLVVRFDKQGDQGAGAILCAAFNLEKLAEGNIAFGENSWRGDHYAALMDEAAEQEERS